MHSDIPQAAEPGQPFQLPLSGPASPAVRAVLHGKPSTAPLARGSWGTDQPEPFWRGPALTGLTHTEVLTQPFVMPDRPLRVNVDALHGTAALTAGAYLMVEVLDARDRILPAFGRASCLIADANGLDLLLQWDGRTSDALAGQVVSLLLLFRAARLYGIHDRPFTSEPLDQLELAVDRPELAAWDTSGFHLVGRSASGQAVCLDKLPIDMRVEADVLDVRLDKLDLHSGRLSVPAEVAAPAQARLQARIERPEGAVESNPVALTLRPALPAMGENTLLLTFCTPRDIRQSVGDIRFEPRKLQYYATTRGLPTTHKSMTVFNRRVGDEHWVWGSSRGEGTLYRAKTRDGIEYYDVTPVESEMHPQHFMDMTYSPERGEYLAFERKFGPSRWLVHRSRDGLRFESLGKVFADFDGLEVTWDPNRGEYVAMQLTMQARLAPRRYTDNLAGSRLDNRCRRVFARRTSPDGLRWTPDQDVIVSGPGTWLAPEHHALAPDRDDPEDLECYWLDIFPYGRRWAGLFMTVAAAPYNFVDAFPYDQGSQGSRHGPHSSVEWVFSDDLHHWERPFRDCPASHDWRIYFGNAPMRLHDRLLFLTGNQLYNLPPEGGAAEGQNLELYSLPLDRIVGLHGQDGAACSTPAFIAPEAPLRLNAAGSLWVEVRDESQRVIPGFEAKRCRLVGADSLGTLLQWGDQTTANLAGRTISLRLHLMGARVFAVHDRTTGG